MPGLLAIVALAACKKGGPPTILDVGDQVAVVGEQLLLQIVASDPDGDTLTFDFAAAGVPDLGSTAAITKTPAGQGIFTFTPLASQIGLQAFDFIASDGNNRDTLTIAIDVRGAVGVGSMPVFRKPLGAGTVLDLDQTDCVEIDIEIADPDSTAVALDQQAPLIEGASLAAGTDGLSGSWSWCPSRAQIEGSDRYTLNLVADDGDNPAVTKEFSIVLRQRGGEDCPGKAPLINHTPTDFQSVLDLPVVADIDDDLGLGSTPYVVYATEDPGDPIDFSKTTLVNMDLTSGDMIAGTWQGLVPNFIANEPEGTAAPLFYLISASDDDDAAGDCDHRTDSPQSGTHRVTVTVGSGASAALCEPCSFDVQCGDGDDLCLPTSGSTGVCGQGCSGDGECPDSYVCSPQTVESVEGQTARQCIPNTGSCSGSGGNCQDDDSEPNDDPTAALQQPAMPPGNLGARVLCDDDEDWYAVELNAAAQLTASLEGDVPPDMDLALTDQGGILIDSSDGLTSSESIVSSCLDAGTYLLRVHSIDSQPSGTYALELALDTSGCGGNMGGDGDCCVDNNTPGCDDPAVQTCVCGNDPFCCDTQWDDVCAGIATNDCDACGGGGSTGGGDPNEDCCTAQATPGCTDATIQACVCANDPFCCDTQWDAMCVGRVGSDLCAPSCAPDDADGPCCQANGTPGCEVDAVEACVCMTDSFCCTDQWDQMCVDNLPPACGSCP
ncbi:MAG: hypothetical protein K0V04_06930 [Deltaproteobacteria bacterium]|nr:hypothetical protein [Deltaproteobacteria bacterium]